MTDKNTGRLYGIGIGPGAPDLLTLRAAAIIQKVPVIIVPRGDTGARSQAYSIVSSLLRPEQDVREFEAPMTRDRPVLDEAWNRLAGEIAGELQAGREVAFLTLGDSTLYSTYDYLLQALRQFRPETEVETVPGITSLSAGAAALNLALTVKNESLAVVPANRGLDYIRQALELFDNVILMKVAPRLSEIQSLLTELGRLEDASFINKCSMPNQFLKRNMALPGELPGDYFSLILVKRSSIGK